MGVLAVRKMWMDTIRSQEAEGLHAAFAVLAGWGVEYWHGDSGWTRANDGSWEVGMAFVCARATGLAECCRGHSWSGLRASSTGKRWVVNWLGEDQQQNLRRWRAMFSNAVPSGECEASFRARAAGRGRLRTGGGWTGHRRHDHDLCLSCLCQTSRRDAPTCPMSTHQQL